MTRIFRSWWSIFGWALLVLALGSGGLDAEQRRDGPPSVERDERHLQIRGEKLVSLEHEAAIREIYERYEEVARKSGHDFDLGVSNVRTLTPDGFRRHAWLDLMTPPTGWRIRQVPNYYDAPWIEGDRVFYELSWERVTDSEERRTFEIAEQVKGDTIREVLEWRLKEGHMAAIPVAVTTYKVLVRFDDRRRSYRAFALWFEQGEDFSLQIQDHVVPEVDTAMVEAAEIITGEEYRDLTEQKPPRESRDGPLSRQTAPVTASDECIGYTKTISHLPLLNTDIQGHAAGYHFVRMSMKADCYGGSDCHVQCAPTITEKTCAESSGANPIGSCHHYPQHRSRISGNSATGASTACGAALACGVKHCCLFGCSPLGGMNFQFSGTGGGLTASVSASGGDTVFDISIDDRVDCPAPDKKNDPCASTAASTVAGRATDAIFIPCDDGGGGGNGGDDDGASGDGAGDGTPILLDFGGRGFELTDLAGGVAFDLDADGTAEHLSWTAPGSDDAFLVLDRDGDGAVDDGSELFGDATPQPPSDEPHGYHALAVFDDDGDGRITAADTVFADLEVWWDRDHDGVADGGERASLAAAGVTAIELDHVVSMRRDRHGNLVRYTSRFHVADPQGRPHYPAADVIFLQDAP
jgi:hypothetical protein